LRIVILTITVVVSRFKERFDGHDVSHRERKQICHSDLDAAAVAGMDMEQEGVGDGILE